MAVASYTIFVPFKDVMKFMRHYYSRHKFMTISVYVLMTLAACNALINPYLYAWLVNVTSGVVKTGVKDFWTIMHPILAIMIFNVTYHICIRSAHFINCFVDSKVQANIALDVTSRLHHFETEWHNNQFIGSMVTAIKRGRGAAHALYDQNCYEFWPTMFVTISTNNLMFTHSVVIGFFFLIFAICFVFASIYVSQKYVLPTNRLYTAEDSRLGGTIADSLTGHTIIQSFGKEASERTRLQRATDTWQKIASVSWIRLNMTTLMQNTLVNLGRAGALGIAAVYWTQDKFSAGDVMYVLMAHRVLADHLDNIGNNLNKAITAINDMEEVVAWTNRQPSITSPEDAHVITDSKGQIEFKNVTFSYNEKDRPALTDFSLLIKPGEKIALVGPSGGGKSTVLKLLQRFYVPQTGDIYLDDKNLDVLDLSSLRANMALVPQDPILFHRSLSENIGFGNPNADQKTIENATEASQISELIASLPKQYDTHVGERGIKLSGGERQRVAIARAIVADTPVLLLDEATSALDSGSEEKIQQAISEASKGRTMIAIAHRLSTIQSVDRIIVIDKGQIIEQGSHDDLLSNPDSLYRRLYESQAKGFLKQPKKTAVTAD